MVNWRYKRFCVRCGNLFDAPTKYSKICNDCNLVPVYNLNRELYIKNKTKIVNKT